MPALPVHPHSQDVERRTVRMYEVRVVETDDSPSHIEGYAAVFNEWSEDLGGFREQIAEGAFAKTIQESDVRALWNHNADYVLGRTRSRTLSLREDERGLFFSVEPPEASWARDLMASIQREDVNQMSFGFETVRDRWENDEEGNIWRTLLEVKLYDVSPVTFPAYPQTSAQVRSKVVDLQGNGELQSAAPPGDGHPADGDQDATSRARVDVLRRRLELAEVHFTE